MRIRVPDFYPQFRCSAAACTDNCCLGWEIDVDDNAAARYAAAEGEFGERLRGALRYDGERHFAMQNGRCPFLGRDNLCEIITRMGEDALCEICARHPRHITPLADAAEIGLGMCCEEACRLILRQREPIRLIETDAPGEQEPSEGSPILQAVLFDARETLFGLLQNRAVPLGVRLGSVLAFAEDVQNMLDAGDAAAVRSVSAAYAQGDALQDLQRSLTGFAFEEPDLLHSLLETVQLYRRMTPLAEDWPQRLAKLEKQLPYLVHKRAAYAAVRDAVRYENLLYCLLFRYFMVGVRTQDVLSGVHTALLNTALVHLLDEDAFTCCETQPLGEQTLLEHMKTVSKEVEYAPVNRELLARASASEDLFVYDRLLPIFLSM